jgi:hypothetical protein
VDDGGAILLESRHISHIRSLWALCQWQVWQAKKAYDWMLNKFYRSIKSDGSKGNLVQVATRPSINWSFHGKLFFDELYRLKKRRRNPL